MIQDFVGPRKYLIVLGESRPLIEQLRSSVFRGEESDSASETDSEFAFESRDELEQIREHVDEREFEELSLNFSLTEDIFIDTVYYQGHSYISRIRNEPLSSASLKVGLPANINRIILSVDHIGVRGVQFVESETDVSPDGAPWYEMLDVEHPLSQVDLKSNDLFVRGFRPIRS